MPFLALWIALLLPLSAQAIGSSQCATFLAAETRSFDPNKPWAAVYDPASTGSMLVPELKRRGYNVLQIVTNPFPNVLIPSLSNEFGSRVLFNGDIEATAQAVLPFAPKVLFMGTETAAVVKDRLGHRLNELGLKLEVNEVELGITNKRRMGVVLEENGLAHMQEKLARSPEEALEWIHAQGLFPGAVVLKPNASAATDAFEICTDRAGVEAAFAAINGKINILNRLNEGVLVQRYVEGPEIVPNLAVRDYRAILTDAWEYEKRNVVVNGKKVRLYKIDWLLDPSDPRVIKSYDYVVRVNRALKNRFGFAHPEVILDALRGYEPVQVDFGTRIMGGGQARITLAATGHSQVDVGVDGALDPVAFDRRFREQPFYQRLKHAAVYSVMTFGNARASYRLDARIKALKSYSHHEFEYKEGAAMDPTDKLTKIVAQIELVHPDRRVIEEDLRTIERWETDKQFEDTP